MVIEGEASEDGQLSLLDLQGRELLRVEVKPSNGYFRENIFVQAAGLAPGIYLLRYRSASALRTVKVVVQR